VTCATNTLEAVGPSSGDIQNTAPFDTRSSLASFQPVKSMPMLLIAFAVLPPEIPTVSHESYAALALLSMIAGCTPPMSTPNGVETWRAGGNLIT
jgi:hypothetical protein